MAAAAFAAVAFDFARGADVAFLAAGAVFGFAAALTVVAEGLAAADFLAGVRLAADFASALAALFWALDRPEDARDAGASGSGAGVRLVIRPLQSVNRDMGVNLGGRERSVPQQLLDGAQIGAAFEQVRGCGVPQSMRAEIGCVLDRCQVLVYQGTNCPLVDPTPPPPEEERWSTFGASQRRSRAGEPPVYCALGWGPVGHRPLLGALPEDPHGAASVVDIVDVETTELTDPDTSRIEQLQDGDISWTDGVVPFCGPLSG